jgi:NH3-dependent NAD+ synthetase
MKMAKYLGIPNSILDSSRQADPDCGRPAEMAAIPLETTDEYLKFVSGEILYLNIDPAIEDYIRHIMNSNSFKSLLPYTHKAKS